MNINELKKHSVITRIAPTDKGDGSYMSDPLIFKGVHNGIICLERGLKNERSFLGEHLELPLHGWDEGWDYYFGSKCDVNYKGIRLKIVNYLIFKLTKLKYRLMSNSF